MIRFLIQPMLDRAYARGYQAGMNDALDEADRRRAAVLDSVWKTIDNNAGRVDGHAPGTRRVVPGTSRGTVGELVQQSEFTSDLPCSAGIKPCPAPSNVVAIHLRRADGKWHL